MPLIRIVRVIILRQEDQSMSVDRPIYMTPGCAKAMKEELHELLYVLRPDMEKQQPGLPGWEIEVKTPIIMLRRGLYDVSIVASVF